MARTSAVEATEYENVTQGLLGVIKIDRNNAPVGEPVEPGDHVFLTDEEVTLTERSHRRPQEDSPFVMREIVHRDPATHDETARFTSPPLRRVEKKASARKAA